MRFESKSFRAESVFPACILFAHVQFVRGPLEVVPNFLHFAGTQRSFDIACRIVCSTRRWPYSGHIPAHLFNPHVLTCERVG